MNINARSFKVFGDVAWSNSKRKRDIVNIFGEKAFSRLVLLEEKFYGAYLCYKRLENRASRYGKLKYTSKLLANSSLRKLHSDEYYFFTAANFIYKEISLLIKEKVLDLQPKLLLQLEALKEERRYHEHGKEWYWGETKRRRPPVSSKGDNFDFDKNMRVLYEVYKAITDKITIPRI